MFIQALNFLLLPRSSLASNDHGNDFLKHEHLSPLGTKLRFTSSFHTETTERLSGSANAQHVLLDWIQKPSERKVLAPISCHTSALGTRHLHHDSASCSSCVVQPTAFPARQKETSEFTHTHGHFCRVGPVRAGPALSSLLQRQEDAIFNRGFGLYKATTPEQQDSELAQQVTKHVICIPLPISPCSGSTGRITQYSKQTEMRADLTQGEHWSYCPGHIHVLRPVPAAAYGCIHCNCAACPKVSMN